MNKYTHAICHEIVCGRLPESALERPIIEVANTTVLRGGGESTSYHPHITVRRNGKQIWRGTHMEFSSTSLEKITGGKLTKAGKHGRNQLFVLTPDMPVN